MSIVLCLYISIKHFLMTLKNIKEQELWITATWNLRKGGL